MSKLGAECRVSGACERWGTARSFSEVGASEGPGSNKGQSLVFKAPPDDSK